MKAKRYIKKPPVYEAVQVNAENMVAVAGSVGGQVLEGTPGRKAVAIPKLHPLSNKAYPSRRNDDDEPIGGDWILKDSAGRYHVVDNETFQSLYIPVPDGLLGNATS